jgi:tRNA pseudouridine55 synthase
MSDIILVDKPSGITSFDVIRRLRKKLNIKKMGHAGTLDPLASGLMIIGIGAGTKKLAEYLKLDKEYVAEILIGRRTTTGDREGEVMEEKTIEAEEAAEIFSAEKISAALSGMTGTLKLPVSAYSAIKKDGVPFYKKARAAEKQGRNIPESELPVREMKVYEAELLDITLQPGDHSDLDIIGDIKECFPIIQVRFKVGSGTYIRSLAEELGRRLGYPASLASLRRTKIGDFKIEEAEII